LNRYYLSKEAYRNSYDINMRNKKDKKFTFYSLYGLGQILTQNELAILLNLTSKFYSEGKTLNLVGIINDLILKEVIMFASSKNITLKTHHKNLLYMPFIIEVNNASLFPELLQLIWDRATNDPLCWFWSNKKYEIEDIIENSTGYLLFDVEQIEPIFIRGLDGDELLIYFNDNPLYEEKIKNSINSFHNNLYIYLT